MPNSPIDAIPTPYAVAIHDAGAANMIAAWVCAAPNPPNLVIAAGPAKAVWEQRFGKGSTGEQIPPDFCGSGCLISGTGWASDLEHRARLAAATAGLRSIAVVDHWVNYAMRFEREGVRQWPDVIWVGDAEAALIARSQFPAIPVEEHRNLYLAQQAREAGPTPDEGDILFLLEPARGSWGGGTPGEFQALDFFMSERTKAGLATNVPIRIRPHPSDPAGKYGDWLEKRHGVSLDTSPDMANALRTARCVVGMNSAGLVIALEAGRRVISALPPNAPPCVLPHTGIERLCTLYSKTHP